MQKLKYINSQIKNTPIPTERQSPFLFEERASHLREESPFLQGEDWGRTRLRMEYIYKYIFSILFILSIWSCETVIESVALPYEERMVIQAFISPQDTLLEVKISKTRPVTGTFPADQFYGSQVYKPLAGATIEISDGVRKANFLFQTISNPNGTEYDNKTGKLVNQTRTGYFLKANEFTIIAGKTYTLTAKTPNLPDVSATCTVPNKKLIESKDFMILKGNIDSVKSGGYYSSGSGSASYNYYNLTKRINITVNDVANEENFYAIAYYSQKISQYKDPVTNIITRQNILNQEPGSDFITDYRQDGKILNFVKAGINVGFYNDDPKQQNNQNQPKIISHNLSIFVATTDKAYYQYNKSIGSGRGLNDDNPFAEPVLTYSNINGGLGVFAGYNTTRVDVDLLKK